MAKLAAYRKKRDFAKTAEPSGDGPDAPPGAAFVIQKHAASRLHYDLRLELDGVMLSWAVTRGPSLVPGDKRLAVHTEDHPIAYNSFEGTIPAGQYGGGTVMIWDRGTWAPEGDPARAMRKGHLDFTLAGEKIKGRFHLVRLKGKGNERQEPWLLIKSDDDDARGAADPDILEEKPLSVASGRTMEAIAADRNGAVWDSNRGPTADARAKRKATARKPKPAADPAPPAPTARRKPASTKMPGTRATMPPALDPALATLAAAAPRSGPWLHEIKWDGYRLLCFKRKAAVRLLTRRGHDWTARFPGIADAVGAMPHESLILDGEAVIADEHGRASFSALQTALGNFGKGIARDAVLYCFDVLYRDGRDLRALPLSDRKDALAGIVPAGNTGALRLSEHIGGDGTAMLRSACELGLEGIISKRTDRPYRSGRSDDWLKVKCVDRQEFVVGGFAPSAVSDHAVGSLLLGYHADGELRFAGRAGSGFTADGARAAFKLLQPLARKAAPFAKKLETAERRGVTFCEPTVVAEIEFRGWTGDDRLRQAAFKGFRSDKTATEIVRETPKPVPAGAAPPQAPPARKPAARKGKATEFAGVALSSPDRLLWEEGNTKADLAGYYEAIAEWLLPAIANRPLSLVRCPDGVAKGCFFQKHSWSGTGDAIHRSLVRDKDGTEEVLFVDTLPGVISLVQASCLEIHVWGSTMADVEKPDRIVMDLDPAPDVPWADVVRAARDLRERLRAMKLESFTKTTGGKGLHVVVPLTPRAGWGEVKDFAHALALAMEADEPHRFLSKATKAARTGRIYVDYLRNGRGATAIAPYSTRARPDAPVAVPIRWAELGPKLRPAEWTLRTVPARLNRLRSDPWEGIGDVRQVLPTLAAPRRGKGRKRPG